MEYNSEQLKQAILNYIADETYDYAIMINGLWGCGKSYFIREVLIDHFYSYSIKYVYVSLYGVDSLQEITKQVLIQNYFGNKKGDEIAGWASLGSTIIFKQLEKNGIDVTNIEGIAEKLKSKFSLKKDTVLIFDDLERAKIPISELMGYINGYVEHQHMKVIIVANEKEVDSKLNNLELKYVVAMNKVIELNKNNNVSDNNSLSLEKLKDRTEQIFEEKSSYNKVKEKLIGETFNYVPDLKESCLSIIENDKKNLDNDFYNIIKDNILGLITIMREKGHENLRTFQFFLSKLNNCVKKSKFCKNQEIVNKLIVENYTFFLEESIELKKGNKQNKYLNSVQLDLSDYIRGLSLLDEKFFDLIIQKNDILKSNNKIDIICREIMDWRNSDENTINKYFDNMISNLDLLNEVQYKRILMNIASLEYNKILKHEKVNSFIEKFKSILISKENINMIIFELRTGLNILDQEKILYANYINILSTNISDSIKNIFMEWFQKGEKEYINIIDRDVVEMDYFVKIEIDDFYRKIVEAKRGYPIWNLNDIFHKVFSSLIINWKDSLYKEKNLSFIEELQNKLDSFDDSDIDKIVKIAIDELKKELKIIENRLS